MDAVPTGVWKEGRESDVSRYRCIDLDDTPGSK